MRSTKICGGDVAWFVFESEEVIMGPYLTYKEAERDLDIQMTECYLGEDYPQPYIDFVEHEDDWFNWQEMDFVENKLYYESDACKKDNLPFKEKIKSKFKRQNYEDLFMNKESESLVKFLKIASQQYKEGKHISTEALKEKLKKLLNKMC